MTWQEVLEHKSLQDLPFKIELNKNGLVIMSPLTNLHGFITVEIGVRLRRILPNGCCVIGASIQTTKGVRVADVIWALKTFVQDNCHQNPFLTAPPICVEIISPSNSKKEISQKM